MTTADATLTATDRVFGKGVAPSATFTADNLDVLRGMNSACIDLIYLDPPFNSNAEYQNPFDREVRFHDVWTMSSRTAAAPPTAKNSRSATSTRSISSPKSDSTAPTWTATFNLCARATTA